MDLLYLNLKLIKITFLNNLSTLVESLNELNFGHVDKIDGMFRKIKFNTKQFRNVLEVLLCTRGNTIVKKKVYNIPVTGAE